MPLPLFADVVDQREAVASMEAALTRPVHAYLLVGPPGSGTQAAAVRFAAGLLCPQAPPDGTCESCRRVLAGVHPDVIHVEREGPFISIDAARSVTRLAATSPVEGARKVIVLDDFHLVQHAGPALLKTIEEPPGTTFFLILADYVPPELVTIASRCVRIDFRARPLDVTPGSEDRHALWLGVPARLDGTGATFATLADELVASLDDSVAHLKARHDVERADLEARNARAAEVGATGRGGKAGARAAKAMLAAGVADMEGRHKRSERRQRTDELRAGLAVLSGAYRDRLVSAPNPSGRAAALGALSYIDKLAKDLEFNPGELLALQALLSRLDRGGRPS